MAPIAQERYRNKPFDRRWVWSWFPSCNGFRTASKNSQSTLFHLETVVQPSYFVCQPYSVLEALPEEERLSDLLQGELGKGNSRAGAFGLANMQVLHFDCLVLRVCRVYLCFLTKESQKANPGAVVQLMITSFMVKLALRAGLSRLEWVVEAATQLCGEGHRVAQPLKDHTITR